MTKILRSLPLLLIFTLALPNCYGMSREPMTVSVLPVTPESSDLALPKAPDPCDTFAIDNESSHALGEVVVSDSLSGYSDFNVTGAGYYEQDICFTANTVTVNGVAIQMPNSGDVQLPSGSWVNVEWKSSSLVEVTNGRDEDGPMR